MLLVGILFYWCEEFPCNMGGLVGHSAGIVESKLLMFGKRKSHCTEDCPHSPPPSTVAEDV